MHGLKAQKRLNQGNTLELRFAKIVQTNCNTKRKSINRYAMSQKNCQTLRKSLAIICLIYLKINLLCVCVRLLNLHSSTTVV